MLIKLSCFNFALSKIVTFWVVPNYAAHIGGEWCTQGTTQNLLCFTYWGHKPLPGCFANFGSCAIGTACHDCSQFSSLSFMYIKDKNSMHSIIKDKKAQWFCPKGKTTEGWWKQANPQLLFVLPPVKRCNTQYYEKHCKLWHNPQPKT